MVWMAALGIALVAGLVLIIDDDDDSTTDTSGGSDTDGGTDTGGGADIDSFIGASGDDEIEGDDENNTILGKNGDDILDGRGGDDRVFGDGGNDSVDGGEGDDAVFGGNGQDLVLGGEGNDLLRGGRDTDFLVDTDGADTIFGDTGDDLIVSSGNLDPATDNDLAAVLLQPMDFTQDADTEGDVVHAGTGDDTVIFGVGDTVTGGSGTDTFMALSWLEGQPAATITDFNPNEDNLIYSYHESEAEPVMSLSMVENDDGTSDALISANGQLVLRVEDQDPDTFDLAEHLVLAVGGDTSAAATA